MPGSPCGLLGTQRGPVLRGVQEAESEPAGGGEGAWKSSSRQSQGHFLLPAPGGSCCMCSPGLRCPFKGPLVDVQAKARRSDAPPI